MTAHVIHRVSSPVDHLAVWAVDRPGGVGYRTGRFVPLCGQGEPRWQYDGTGHRWAHVPPPEVGRRPICAACKRQVHRFTVALGWASKGPVQR